MVMFSYIVQALAITPKEERTADIRLIFRRDSVTIEEEDSRWVSNVYYSAWIDYTWTMTHRSSSGCGQTHMMSL